MLHVWDKNANRNWYTYYYKQLTMVQLGFPILSIVIRKCFNSFMRGIIEMSSFRCIKNKTQVTAYHVVGLKSQYLWVTLTPIPSLWRIPGICILVYPSVYLIDSQSKTNYITNRMGRKSKLQSKEKKCDVWRLKIRITNCKS